MRGDSGRGRYAIDRRVAQRRRLEIVAQHTRRRNRAELQQRRQCAADRDRESRDGPEHDVPAARRRQLRLDEVGEQRSQPELGHETDRAADDCRRQHEQQKLRKV